MAEQRIIVTLDEEGNITAKTEGFKGDACLDELQELMKGIAEVNEIKKTDDYYQEQTQSNQKEIRRKL